MLADRSGGAVEHRLRCDGNGRFTDATSESTSRRYQRSDVYSHRGDPKTRIIAKLMRANSQTCLAVLPARNFKTERRLKSGSAQA